MHLKYIWKYLCIYSSPQKSLKTLHVAFIKKKQFCGFYTFLVFSEMLVELVECCSSVYYYSCNVIKKLVYSNSRFYSLFISYNGYYFIFIYIINNSSLRLKCLALHYNIHNFISNVILICVLLLYIYIYIYIQWGKKVFSQPPIVQVLPLKKMREACNFHRRYTSTMRDKIRKKNPDNHIVGFLKNLFANYGGK